MPGVQYDIKFKIDSIDARVKGVENQLRDLARTADKSVSSVENTVSKIKYAVGAAFTLGAAKSFVTELINVRGQFEQLSIALETMLGSKSKADALTREIVELAAKTPFSLADVGAGAKQLLAFGESSSTVVETLRRMGDIAAGTGTDIRGLNLAYGQVMTKGKLQAQEMYQFAERGVPIIQELAKVMNVSQAEVSKLVEQGKVGFPIVQKALFNLTDEGGRFYNLMEKQSKSVTGMVSNLGDAYDRMLNKIGQDGEGAIKGSISALTYLVENYEEVINIVAVAASTYGAYRAALIAVAAAQRMQNLDSSISLFQNLTKAIKGTSAAQAALNLVSKANPFVLLATALAGIVTYMVLFNKELTVTEKVTAQLAEKSDEIQVSVGKLGKAYADEAAALKKTAPGSEERKKAIESLTEKYGYLFKGVDLLNASEKDLNKLINDGNKLLRERGELALLIAARDEAARKKNETGSRLTEFTSSYKGDRKEKVYVSVVKRLQDEYFAAYQLETEYSGKINKLNEKSRNAKLKDSNKVNTELTKEEKKRLEEIEKNELEWLQRRREAYREFYKTIKKSQEDSLLAGRKQINDKANVYGAGRKLQIPSELENAQETLNKYKTIQQKITDIQVDYEKKRKELARAGGNRENQKLLDKEEEKAIRSIINIPVEDELSKWTDGLYRLTDGLSEVADVMDSKILKSITNITGNVSNAIASFGELKKVSDDPNSSTMQKAGAVGGMVGAVISVVSVFKTLAESTFSTAEGVKTLGETLDELNESIKDRNEYGSIGQRSNLYSQNIGAMQTWDIEGTKLEETVNANYNGAIKDLLDEQGNVRQGVWDDMLAYESVSKELFETLKTYQNLKDEYDKLEKEKNEEKIKDEQSLLNAKIKTLQKELLWTAKGSKEEVELRKKIIDENWQLQAADAKERIKNEEELAAELNLIWEQNQADKRELDRVYAEEKKSRDEKALNEAAEKLQEKQRQLLEDTLGLTTNIFADSIKQGLDQGLTFADSFGKNLDQILKNAVVNGLSMDILKPRIAEINRAFSELTRDGDFSKDDIDIIKENYGVGTDFYNKTQKEYSAAQDLVKSMFPTGAKTQNSMEGAIRSQLSEETGTVLAGAMNAMRLDIKSMTSAALAGNDYLKKIELNTRLLKDINDKMSTGGMRENGW